MQITQAAEQKLQKLSHDLGDPAYLRIEGYLGSCRGSKPVLKPASEPAETDTVIETGTLSLCLVEEHTELLQSATMDCDDSFLGKGLTLTWPHQDNCPCHK
jgi:Fe-S cluster assembly iron-binding protein IscA